MNPLAAVMIVAIELAVTVLPAAAQTPDAAVLTPGAIFDRARRVANARTFPAYYTYRIDLVFTHKGNSKARHYRVTVRDRDGVAYAEPLKDSPSDRLDTTPRVEPKPPLVSPTRTFGLSRTGSAGTSMFEGDSSEQPSAIPAEPAVIGRAVAVAREYNVTLVGLETLDGHDVYHLALVPRFAPERNVMRELFVDRTTFEAVRIVIAVSAGVGPVRVHPVATIAYQHFAAGYVIATASAYVQMRFGFLSYGGDASVRISDPTAVDAPPDWMFDAALLARHRASEGKSR